MSPARPGCSARQSTIGRLIRQQVAEQQQITCSVGIAANKFLAKLASVHCKPDGLLVIPAGGALEFLHPLPISALWGVGERTGQTLARLGLRTVGDIARTPLSALEARARQGSSGPPARAGLGPRRPRGRGRGAGEERRCRGDVRRSTSPTRRWSGASCYGCRAGRPARSARPDMRPGLSSSSCARPTSRPSPGPRPCPRPPARRSGSMQPPARCTRRPGSAVRPGFGSSACGRPAWCRPRRPPPSLRWASGGASWRDAESALDRITGRFGPDAVRPAALVDRGSQTRPPGDSASEPRRDAGRPGEPGKD